MATGPIDGNFDTLKLDKVTRRFAGITALDGLDLTIKRGEFIALLGPSGCGKSTALNCLAGLLPLTGGAIWLDDQRIDVLRPEQRGFGMVFQSYALFPHMTVRKNIGFGLMMRKVAKAEIDRRVTDALKMVRLEAHAEKLPGQLSGGQQQRVAIARAIVVQPPLVLMDEPLSNLDAKLRLEMRVEIRRIHRELGRSTIYVTHDQDEALSLADRIVVLHDGRVQQVGPPEDLYARPSNLEVARFMGYQNSLSLGVVGNGTGETKLAGPGVTLQGVGKVNTPRAIASIRPEDLVAGAEGDNIVEARVTGAEYAGREFVGTAVTQDGQPVIFRSLRRISQDEVVRLSVPTERVRVFAEPGA
ncbi:ABC transporter ATP-binding protein [Aliidongia dinghuensis]|uniref:ABC transporter ATP-binding protein n=1 Tax=Aliidongia dinghuensis TaxID=1867774 RepID=A0A8J2YQV3_9PROT|nr:ABC transporter ATP-binding protein [Aliidongia dinghuensis]GGF09931.1 ABC transporter ATP-binding protein [Aliidongia dinghuensis]